MISNLYNKINYISGLRYLFSTFIREYDISKANINILYSKGIISKDYYSKLNIATREERTHSIGLEQLYNKEVTKVLQDGIIEAKKNLFESNDIQDGDILSIKNDAVFVINKILSNTKFGDYIEFRLKNVFTNFVQLNKIEIYYNNDKANNIENVKIKGLGKNKCLHDDFMTDFIIYIIGEIESGSIDSAISSFTDFYDDYVNHRLNIGYYREYNPQSKYSIIGRDLKISYADNDEYTKTRVININYNIHILRELYGYISEIYFINKRF